MRNFRAALARSLASLAILALWLGAYVFLIRPGLLSWGATPAELARQFPGDDLVASPGLSATRAITINGRPEDVWPWIVQIGYDRAGFYGYDLIENLGSKRGIRSEDKVVPELQRLAIGDRVYMSRIAYMEIGALEPNRLLIWAGGKPPSGAFAFELLPLDARRTRLVVRTHIGYHWTDRRIWLDLFTEFGDHVAVPRMLRGIRDRVEGRPAQSLAVQAVEIGVWIAALLEFGAALLLIQIVRAWWKFCWAALVSGAVLLFALYARQPVWLGAALQLPALAVMAWAWRQRPNLCA